MKVTKAKCAPSSCWRHTCGSRQWTRNVRGSFPPALHAKPTPQEHIARHSRWLNCLWWAVAQSQRGFLWTNGEWRPSPCLLLPILPIPGRRIRGTHTCVQKSVRHIRDAHRDQAGQWPTNGHAFEEYAEEEGFHHRRVTPGWPEANGDVRNFSDWKWLKKGIRDTMRDNESDDEVDPRRRQQIPGRLTMMQTQRRELKPRNVCRDQKHRTTLRRPTQRPAAGPGERLPKRVKPLDTKILFVIRWEVWWPDTKRTWTPDPGHQHPPLYILNVSLLFASYACNVRGSDPRSSYTFDIKDISNALQMPRDRRG